MTEEFKANPNLVNKELADRSHAHTSFSPEKRAEQEIQGFADHVQNVYEELKKHAKTEAQKAFLISEMQRYQSGYATKYNAELAAKGRTFSSMITGGSNFPVRRHEKANRAEQNRYEEMKAWDDRAQAAILRELKKMAIEEGGGEVEVLKAKIASAEQLQEKMKAANAIIRKNISPAEQIAQLINLGFDAARVHKLLQPDFVGRVGFPAFELTNNNANIHRMKERIGELEKKEATPSGDIPFKGGTMHDNKEDDRIQLFFDQKPPQAMIDKLKGEGWKWAPSIGAWQRKRTDNALFSARRILGLEQQNPVFVPEKEELRKVESEIPEPEHRDSTIVKKQVEALGVKVLRAKIDGYNPELIRLTVPTDTPPIIGEIRREIARGFNGLPIPTKTWVWFKKPVPIKESPTLEKLQKQFEEKEIKPAFEVHDRLQKVIDIIKIYRDKGLTFEDLLAGLKGAYLAQTDYVRGSNLNAQKLTDDLKKSGYTNLRELWRKIIVQAPEKKPPLLYPSPEESTKPVNDTWKMTLQEFEKIKPFLKGIEEVRFEATPLKIPLSPEYLNWLKVELHRSDDPIIAESKKNKGFRLFVKSIDEAKKEFVVEKDVYVNHANGIVSEMPGTEYNRGKKYPVENFDIMPFSEYLKKEGIKFQYKESLGFKYVRVHWNGGEGWQLEYQTDKKEWHSVNTKNFLTLDEINKLLNSGEAKLYVYDTRGEEFFRWKPFTVPYPEFKWHEYFTEKGKGKFYELLHATWDNLMNIWMWRTSITDAEKHYESQEISEPQLKASFVPIERWKVREQDLIKFLGEHDKPDFGGSCPHYIKDRIEDFKSQTLSKFPQVERDKYELILDVLLSKARAKIEADKQPKPADKGIKTVVPYPEVKKEKEPWEMTFAEFEELFRTKYGDSGFSFAERVGISLGIGSQAGQPLRIVDGKKFGYNESNVRDNWRKAVIKRAIELGKHIPQHVLDDYAKMREEPVPEPLKPDTSSKDYKAGYNLAIQGRIAPAVPAWTDQGKADFAQGYKDGQKDKTRKENEELLAKDKAERDRHIEEFGKPVQTPEKPKANLLQRLKEASTVIELQVLQREIKESSYPEAKKYELLSLTEGRLSAMGVEFKPKVIGAPTKQEQALREAREKSHEGKRLKGQQTLGSAVSTSRRLGEFEVKPPIAQTRQPEPLKFKPPVPMSREQLLRRMKATYQPIISPKPKLLYVPEEKAVKQDAESVLLSRLDALAEKTRLKRELNALKNGVE